MKVFVAMLLLANLASWSWLGWQQGISGEMPPKPSAPIFIPAKNELLMLDIAKADESNRPVSKEKVSETPASQTDLPSQSENQGVVEEFSEPEMWCGLSDVFQTEEEANDWLSKWVSAGGVGSANPVVAPVSSTWWVHLPPFAAEADARVMLAELQTKKIDSFYMRTGELAGGISLGVFSRKESAYLWQADLQKRGYPALVKEIPRMGKLFQVAIELRARPLLAQPEFEEFLSPQSKPGVREIPCK